MAAVLARRAAVRDQGEETEEPPLSLIQWRMGPAGQGFCFYFFFVDLS